MNKKVLLSTIQINQYTFNKLPKFKCLFCKHLFNKQPHSKNITHCYGCRPIKR